MVRRNNNVTFVAVKHENRTRDSYRDTHQPPVLKNSKIRNNCIIIISTKATKKISRSLLFSKANAYDSIKPLTFSSSSNLLLSSDKTTFSYLDSDTTISLIQRSNYGKELLPLAVLSSRLRFVADIVLRLYYVSPRSVSFFRFSISFS